MYILKRRRKILNFLYKYQANIEFKVTKKGWIPIPQVHIVYDQDVKIENLSSNANDLEHNNQVI